jgi:hypothetical protein
MTIFNLRAWNNATFHWTRDLTEWAAIYDFSNATIRMQARTSPYQPDPPVYEWVSGALSGGVVSFDPATKLCTFSAPVSDMARMPPALNYDCRLELSGGENVVMFSGAMFFSPGVTRGPSDSSATGVSGVGDTVTVDGETRITQAALPLSLSAAVSAAQIAASGAQSSLFISALLFG